MNIRTRFAHEGCKLDPHRLSRVILEIDVKIYWFAGSAFSRCQEELGNDKLQSQENETSSTMNIRRMLETQFHNNSSAKGVNNATIIGSGVVIDYGESSRQTNEGSKCR